MVYLCTDLIAAPGAVVQITRVGTAWSKISGLQPELAYLARAQVIVGSNPTRPTMHLTIVGFRQLLGQVITESSRLERTFDSDIKRLR